MVTNIWARGGPASGYLFIRYLKSVVLLAALPVSLLFAWMIPAATEGLVRLANSERYRATRYLGLPADPPLPPATRRRRHVVP
jgi:hypothetical protein